MTERTLIRNARIVTCSEPPAGVIADGDILLDGDRVAEVSAGRLAVDEHAVRVVDVRGAAVLPGLGDAHVHLSWPLDFVFDHVSVANAPAAPHALDVAAVARTYLESGYTLVIGAGVSQPFDDIRTRDAIDRGYLPGPRILPSGTMITEAGAISADTGMTTVVTDARDLREAVARQCDTGVRVLKLFISGDGIVPEYPSDDVYMNDEMLAAAVDEADRHGAFISVHARGSASVAMAARTGVRLIHHACFLDEAALRELRARRDDVWVCPGLHYLYAMVSGHAEPWGVTPDKIERAGYEKEFHAQVEGLRLLRDEGIRIVAGGDFGHQWTRHGTYAAELERYVELVGMSPVEAINTATRDLGPLVGFDVGQIRPGALADLLIVDGDPTTDITVLQDPDRRRAVLKGGEFAYVNPRLYP
ncbi:Imidazolonepropionase [Parafrankia irregularis]|uniref:Imidazolonepropionase n=1 Tax=Parafrankia irregularis TaxID=795642 RepID=A0A0S4QIE8_9ACTN|nr:MULTISPECIES: amidohydrolase family protein [Parafrankia]MBE3203849.1 amidohydrolase family protein [Parafrankia sp. CH37]CUU55281.1 Imidazolonepropionase [Parafrankia irregularis]